MKNFSELYRESVQNLRGGNRDINNAALNFIELRDIKPAIDKLFEESIRNQETRSEILAKIIEIININPIAIEEDYREIITADWIYNTARAILAPKTIHEDGKRFIVGRRRGQNGGFTFTEIQESTIEENLLQQEEKTIDQIEKEISETNIQIEKVESQERKLEKYYYPHVKQWAQENGFERCEITGGLIPGPKWENPDLIEMYFDFGKNISQLNIEVTSFEVKLKIDPQAIWQAAHYSKFSHFTFIAFALTEEEVRAADRVFELAVKFGLGVLVLEKRHGDEIKFKSIHSPTKNNPPSSEIEVIISRFLDSERFSNTKKQLMEERQKLTHHLLQGINLVIGGAIPQR